MTPEEGALEARVVIDTRAHDRTPLISFIVPVYNVQDYVIQTLDSLATENFQQVELIIVNDGSTDDSLARVLDWVSTMEAKCLVLEQANAGLSAARTTGMEYAQGEYVGFCDSDDWADVNAFVRLAQFAKERDCEVGLLRSAVYDDMTHDTYDFYDAGVWDGILGRASTLVTNSIREPRLFRLEFNANYRLIRRSFLFEHGVEFPRGRLFEDLEPHFVEIVYAKRIALMDATGYFYRVARPGKLTYDRGMRRFDVLYAARSSLKEVLSGGIDEVGLAVVFLSLCRVVFWSGQFVPNKERRKFFTGASEMFQSMVPLSARQDAIVRWSGDEFEALLVAAFATGAVGFLVESSCGNKRSLLKAMPMITNRALGGRARRHALRKARRMLTFK